MASETHSRSYPWLAALYGIALLASLFLKGDESSESNSPQNKPTKENDSRPSQITVIPETRPSAISNNQAQGSKEDTPRWKKILEYGAFVIALGLLIVNICQSCSTEKAAKAAANSVILAQNSSQIDQRAWVSVSDMKFIPRGDQFDVNVVFGNTGKTPAKDFTIREAGELVQKGKVPTAEESLQPGHGIIAPNGTFHSKLSANGYYDARLGNLIVHGKIDYNDVFGNGHWTKFCYYWIPGVAGSEGGFAPCDSGNSIDDLKPPSLLK
jgi:hypothetical protein